MIMRLIHGSLAGNATFAFINEGSILRSVVNFEEALKRHWDDFVHYSRALAGSIDRGDDLLQESLVRAWRGYDKLKDSQAFKPWVLRIISNTHKSLVRLSWQKGLSVSNLLKTNRRRNHYLTKKKNWSE